MERQDLDPRAAPLSTGDQEQAAAAELTRARHAARMGQGAARAAPTEQRMSAAKQREIAERGRGVAKRLGAAAADHNWPYVLVVAVSMVNDAVDIFGLNLLLGLDQVFDVGSLSIMLGARLFIRQQEIGWVGWGVSKVFVWFVEIVPLIGIVPTWTIAALYTWRYAVRRRRVRQREAEDRAQREFAGEEEYGYA